MVKFFQRNIFACLSHILILQWLRYFSIFQLKLNVYSPKFEINNPIFFYVFECWLHYLALVKIFQHIIFASLSYIRILQWFRFFFRFSSLKSMFIFPSLKLTTQYSIIYLNAGFTISPWLSFFNVNFLHV